MSDQNKTIEPMLQFFKYKHLPEHLSEISAHFAKLADKLTRILPRNPERTVALRKLLESKDCAVRSSLPTSRRNFKQTAEN